MPFREAHEAAGGCVRIAEGRGVELEALTDAELASVSPMLTPQVREVLLISGSLASRNTVGGTSPQRVAEQIEQLRNQAQTFRKHR